MVRFTVSDLVNKGIKIPDGILAPKVKSNAQVNLDASSYPQGIFIPGNVPSSKNSRINFTQLDSKDVAVRKTNGKLNSKSFGSKLVSKYKLETKSNFANMKKQFDEKRISKYTIDDAVRCQFFFIRDSKRRFDFQNAIQVVADIMKDHKWIVDDDMEHFLPYPPQSPPFYAINPQHAGVIITIL